MAITHDITWKFRTVFTGAYTFFGKVEHDAINRIVKGTYVSMENKEARESMKKAQKAVADHTAAVEAARKAFDEAPDSGKGEKAKTLKRAQQELVMLQEEHNVVDVLPEGNGELSLAIDKVPDVIRTAEVEVDGKSQTFTFVDYSVLYRELKAKHFPEAVDA